MNISLRVNTYLGAAFFAFAAIASSCATKKAADKTVTLKTTTTAGGSTATATIGAGKKEGIKKFSDLIGKVKADSGLFNTYKVDGKYYFEVPDSIISREMLVVTRFVKTPVGLKSFASCAVVAPGKV
jgi:hypothetical protein